MSDPTDTAAVIKLPPTPPPPIESIPAPQPTPAPTTTTPSNHCKHIYWNLLTLIQHHSANHDAILYSIAQTARCDHLTDLTPLRQRYQHKLGTDLYNRATAVAGELSDNERAVVRKVVGYYADYAESSVVSALPMSTWLYYQVFARSFGQIASSVTLGQIGTAVTIASVAFQGGRHVNRLRREFNHQKAKMAEKEAKKAAEKKEAAEKEGKVQQGAGHGGEVPLHMRHSQQAHARSQQYASSSSSSDKHQSHSDNPEKSGQQKQHQQKDAKGHNQHQQHSKKSSDD